MDPRPTPTAERGREAEDLACTWLRERGLRLLERNYRSPFGEIDIVMQEGGTLVFVEVRYRRSASHGSAAETVGAQKQARLRATAEHYLQARRDSKKPCRFDIVAVSGSRMDAGIEWLPNAF
jgi:putative endonuclease